MYFIKTFLLIAVFSGLTAFGDGDWEKDVREMADRHCRLLEAELKCKQQPGDPVLLEAYERLYQEMVVLSDRMEKKYKRKHTINEKALTMYNAEMEKCQAKKDLVIWEEEMLKKVEDGGQHMKQEMSPLIDKSDSLLRKIRKE